MNELGERFTARVKADRLPQPGEPLQDDFIIRPDKNPNTRGALARFPATWTPDGALPADADLVLVWGEGFDLRFVPPGARTVVLDAWANPAHEKTDAFIPISIQTERRGTYTNFEGKLGSFEPCFPRPEGIVDAEALFVALAAPEQARAAE